MKRIERMKSYGSATPQEFDERRSHVFPIQVAYTFAKDCLRKTAEKPEKLTEFTNEINHQIQQVAIQRPNVASPQVFGNRGIEQSITHSELQQILNKTYYTPDAWNVIFKGRNALSYGKNLSMVNNNDMNDIMYNRNEYEKLRTTHWGKTRKQKQRKLKSRRKTRRNGPV